MYIDWRITLLSAVSFIAMYMAVFWLIVLLEHRNRLEKDPRPTRYPSVSVIIPAYNEEKNIKRTIESVLRLDYPGVVKVFVVDDGSTDRTYEVAKPFADAGRIVLIKKPNGGKASAMNAALKQVDTELVASLDADSHVSPRALHYMVGHFDDPEVAAVTPALKVARPGGLVQQVQWVEYLVNILQRKLFALLDVLYVTPGPFSVYRKDVLDEVGWFDEDNITEDMEIALRIQDAGYRIENSVKAEVWTVAPMNMYTLFNQRVRWYRGLVINIGKYKHMVFSGKHGLLGIFLLPLTIATIFFSIAGAALMLHSLGETVWNVLKQAYFMLVVGFNPVFQFDFMQWLFTQNVFVVMITGFVLLTTLTIMWLSHKLSDEKLAWPFKLGYVAYIAIYFVLLASVWATSLFKQFVGTAKKW